MIFLSYTSGTKGFKFMRKPNNVIFHGVTAMFDEHMFPSCPDNISPGSTCIGDNYPLLSLLFLQKTEDGLMGVHYHLLGCIPQLGGYHRSKDRLFRDLSSHRQDHQILWLCRRGLHKERV